MVAGAPARAARGRLPHRLRERELGMRLQPGERRAQLVRGVARKRCWLRLAADTSSSRPFSAPTSGRVSGGAPAASIGRRSPAERALISSKAARAAPGRASRRTRR